jgi:hypothetical protein
MLDTTNQKNHLSLVFANSCLTVSTGGETEVAKRYKEFKWAIIILALLGVLFVCEVVYILMRYKL